MTVHETITAALVPAMPNTWARELPPDPVWPALVFDVDSEPEEAWSMAGGYTAHDVNVYLLPAE